MDDSKRELIKEKIVEKDKAKLRYKQKLELVKQHYGIEFDINYFENYNIDKIKFVNLDYHNAKNISVVYDYKIKKYNYINYEYDSEFAVRNLNDKKIINGINRERNLKLVIGEIERLHSEYLKELHEIDNNYSIENTRNGANNDAILEIKKKNENN